MAEILAIETIVTDSNVYQGRPIVAGSAVTVAEIAAATNFKGATPPELADQLNLTLAEVYAALAYYHAHRSAIDEDIRASRDQAELLLEMKQRRAWIEDLKPQIAAFCEKWQIVEFALFGSVLTEDFRVDSDVDVLVTFAPDVSLGWNIFTLEDELKGILGRGVDLVTRTGVEQSNNHLLRKSILESAEVLHAA